MTSVHALLLCAGAFLLGAIPFGFIAGKLKGIDIREHGSGNIGATNTLRVLGLKVAIPVFLLDVLKGYLPVALANRMHLNAGWVVTAGLAAILGHTFSPFLRFKGGKGVATSLGVLLGFSPAVAGWSALVFLVPVLITRYVSLGSILGAVAQAILFFALGYPLPYRLFGLLIAAFVIVKHKENIKRLLNGTESRLGEKKTGDK